jgi:hypothetical protein
MSFVLIKTWTDIVNFYRSTGYDHDLQGVGLIACMIQLEFENLASINTFYGGIRLDKL